MNQTEIEDAAREGIATAVSQMAGWDFTRFTDRERREHYASAKEAGLDAFRAELALRAGRAPAAATEPTTAADAIRTFVALLERQGSVAADVARQARAHIDTLAALRGAPPASPTAAELREIECIRERCEQGPSHEDDVRDLLTIIDRLVAGRAPATPTAPTTDVYEECAKACYREAMRHGVHDSTTAALSRAAQEILALRGAPPAAPATTIPADQREAILAIIAKHGCYCDGDEGADGCAGTCWGARIEAILRAAPAPADATTDAKPRERLYWLKDDTEHGERDPHELIYTAWSNEDVQPPCVVEVERADMLPNGFLAVRPDPDDEDCLLVTEHETEAEAHAVVSGPSAPPAPPAVEVRDA